jgi:hypothetical protein
VAAVAVEPRLVRVAGDAAGEDLNRVTEAPEICQPASEPDRGVGTRRIAIEICLRLCQIRLETGLLLADRRRRDERLPEQRRRFRSLRRRGGLQCDEERGRAEER